MAKEIYLGSGGITGISLGSTQVKKVYVGSDLVWEEIAGNQTVTAPVKSLAITGYAPTASDHQFITVPSSTIAITGQTPAATTVAFQPSSLYASGEKGGFYDVSNLSTLWQNPTGTTAVTTDNQTVNRINDISGNNHHLRADGINTGSTSPKYRTDGTYHWLETVTATSITACSLTSSAATLFTLKMPFTLGIASRFVDSTTANAVCSVGVMANTTYNNNFIIVGRYPPLSAGRLSMQSSTTGVSLYHDSTPTDTAPVTGNSAQIIAEFRSGTKSYYLNGTSLEDTTTTWTTQELTSDCFITFNGGGVADRSYVFFVIDRLLTSQEKADLSTWIAAKIP